MDRNNMARKNSAPLYEPPRAVRLDDVSIGAGLCVAGTGPSSSTCVSGLSPSEECQAGATPSVVCSAGSTVV